MEAPDASRVHHGQVCLVLLAVDILHASDAVAILVEVGAVCPDDVSLQVLDVARDLGRVLVRDVNVRDPEVLFRTRVRAGLGRLVTEFD